MGELSKLYLPWSKKRKEIGKILGNESIIGEAWDLAEDQAFLYLWRLIG